LSLPAEYRCAYRPTGDPDGSFVTLARVSGRDVWCGMGKTWKNVMNGTGCSKNKPMPPEAQVAAEALETWPCEASQD